MSKDKIPHGQSYEEIADFWDTHSLADYWAQTEPAEFELSEQARRHYLVSVDRESLRREQKLARIRGISTESRVNLLSAQSPGTLPGSSAT